MTKEEYEKLLQSDYWKGYSYSLIKERNFTCEDCGRSFPNMRNMLQVHHLVYRDANPWSYKPEELIVLCKECHKKRHGIYPDEEVILEEETANEKVSEQSYTNTYTEEMSKRYAYDNLPRKKRKWFKYVVLAYVIIYLFYLVLKDDSKEQKAQETIVPVEAPISTDVVDKQVEMAVPVKAKKKSVTKKQDAKKKNSNAEMVKPLVEQKQRIVIESPIPSEMKIPQGGNMYDETNDKQNTIIELPKEEKQMNTERKRAKRIGIRPEKKASDIWEKVNRKGF